MVQALARFGGCIDDEVLAADGITELDRYAVVPGTRDFRPGLFLD